MRPEMAKTRLGERIFGALATRYPIRLVAGLVVGAVVLSGTAVYIGPSHFQEERSPVSGSVAANELTGNAFRIMEEQRAADREDDLRDMTRYWNQLKAEESAQGSSTTVPSANVRPFADHWEESADNAPHRYEVQIERLEQRIEAMLAEADLDPDKNTPLFYREIDRLDDQIEMLRLHAMKDVSGDGPFSRDQVQVGPDIPYPYPDADY